MMSQMGGPQVMYPRGTKNRGVSKMTLLHFSFPAPLAEVIQKVIKNMEFYAGFLGFPQFYDLNFFFLLILKWAVMTFYSAISEATWRLPPEGTR